MADENDGGVWGNLLVVILLLPVWLVWVAIKALLELGRDKEAEKHAREIAETQALYNETKSLSDAFERGSAQAAAYAIGKEVASRTKCEDPPTTEILNDVVEIITELYRSEGFGEFGEVDCEAQRGTDEWVLLRNRLREKRRIYAAGSEHLEIFIKTMLDSLGAFAAALPAIACPPVEDDEDEYDEKTSGFLSLSAPLPDLVKLPGHAIGKIIAPFFYEEARKAKMFVGERDQLLRNTCEASGIPYEKLGQSSRELLLAKDAKGSPQEIAHQFLKGTVLEKLFNHTVPFPIPEAARFEHMHIVAGSGHGKTQTLQLLLESDLKAAIEDGRSVVVIDSQGDLIDKIIHMPCFKPGAENSLAERLLLVDPNDTEHPVALNMFDINRERMDGYSAKNREMILNGTVELYAYLFGALLGAELTQKQDVIFRFLARLLLEIPNATITTLRQLMEDGQPFLAHMQRLEGAPRAFFETQFFDKSFDDTKKQVLRRVWGILGNAVLERMFDHPRNKVDMFDAINSGKIVLINTAQDLLKTEGCQIFGRFFIAMIAQAALQRAALNPKDRTPTFVYIDEASQYIDDKVEDLLNQARKYNVAMVLAHQNLDQLSTAQRATFMSSTAIKMAGGVSSKDARLFAAEMRCEPEFIMGASKDKGGAQFACYVRNETPHAMIVRVPFGAIERQGRITGEEYQTLLAANRSRYAAATSDAEALPASASTEQLREDGANKNGAAPSGKQKKHVVVGLEEPEPL